ncbi:cbb3-type cytochrome oxidase assembly protein CcoS [Thalassomonas haliotis]|uniref:Cbb3-type cytochrome oxidase assembly protein CcoS n=1 Tax=Thalassomonas haliotis TaxID=485448 RepID=A0ABY7VAW6_9GAMM|nr:cbb3-type cytochrome oxidase assembly protein CcoS [Thalassomonas haliotis]WDE10032.1 cbb3-type cytochrome oxidase assembly protein CcoS [Thalassomonas haliotis]
MSVIYVLIPIAVLLTALGIYLFFWAVKTEQFDDLEKQGLSILFDDENNSADKGKDEQAKADQASSQQETDSKSDNNRMPE